MINESTITKKLEWKKKNKYLPYNIVNNDIKLLNYNLLLTRALNNSKFYA